MSLVEQALSYVRAISPYQPGKPISELAREMGIPVEKIVKLASNENPLGMSPRARGAVEAAISGVERYPDQFELIGAVAERCGVAQNQVVLGHGSNDVLDLIARVPVDWRRVDCDASEELRPRSRRHACRNPA